MANVHSYQSAICPKAGSQEGCAGYIQFVRKKFFKGWKQGNTPEKNFEIPAFGGVFFCVLVFLLSRRPINREHAKRLLRTSVEA